MIRIQEVFELVCPAALIWQIWPGWAALVDQRSDTGAVRSDRSPAQHCICAAQTCIWTYSRSISGVISTGHLPEGCHGLRSVSAGRDGTPAVCSAKCWRPIWLKSAWANQIRDLITSRGHERTWSSWHASHLLLLKHHHRTKLMEMMEM